MPAKNESQSNRLFKTAKKLFVLQNFVKHSNVRAEFYWRISISIEKPDPMDAQHFSICKLKLLNRLFKRAE